MVEYINLKVMGIVMDCGTTTSLPYNEAYELKIWVFRAWDIGIKKINLEDRYSNLKNPRSEIKSIGDLYSKVLIPPSDLKTQAEIKEELEGRQITVYFCYDYPKDSKGNPKKLPDDTDPPKTELGIIKRFDKVKGGFIECKIGGTASNVDYWKVKYDINEIYRWNDEYNILNEFNPNFDLLTVG